MRLANLNERLVIVTGDDEPSTHAVDVESASAGRFDADPQLVYDRWAEFRAWAQSADLPEGDAIDSNLLGAPAPTPRQVIAVGLNYRDHALEADVALPEEPVVFTKFPSCIAGPYCEITLPTGGHTDWEVELVAVIGSRASAVREHEAWSYVAGLTIGQDLSERDSQMRGPIPQFSLAKSFSGFGPIGPWLVTVDEFDDPDDLAIECTVSGKAVQRARTKDMIFSVPQIISYLSGVITLMPGDVVFTGTPAGVGAGRTPPRFLTPSDELVSRIEGIGELRHRFELESGVR